MLEEWLSIRSCVVVHSSHCDVIMNWFVNLFAMVSDRRDLNQYYHSLGRGYINCVLMQWIRPPYSDLYIRFTTTLSYQLFLFLSDAFYWYSWTHMCGGCWLYQSFSCLQQVRQWSRKRLSKAHSEMHWSWLDSSDNVVDFILGKRAATPAENTPAHCFWLHYNSLYISLQTYPFLLLQLYFCPVPEQILILEMR